MANSNKFLSRFIGNLSALVGLRSAVFGGFIRDSLVGFEPKDVDLIIFSDDQTAKQKFYGFLMAHNVIVEVLPTGENYGELADHSDDCYCVSWSIDKIKVTDKTSGDTFLMDVIFQKSSYIFNNFSPDFAVNRMYVEGDCFDQFLTGDCDMSLSKEALKELATRTLTPVPGMSQKRKLKIPQGFSLASE